MTQAQALTRALVLAICAPTESKAQQAVDLAAQIAQGLDAATVEQCKSKALQDLEGQT